MNEIETTDKSSDGPKRGDIFRKNNDTFMLIQLSDLEHILVSLRDGDVYRRPSDTVEGAFDDSRDQFQEVSKCTIKPKV